MEREGVASAAAAAAAVLPKASFVCCFVSPSTSPASLIKSKLLINKRRTSNGTALESAVDGRRRPESRASDATGTDQSRGFVMSVHQLSELWNYDMTLAHNLLGLPLRKCSAVPQEEDSLPAMDIKRFKELKDSIKKMWMHAEVIFTVRKTDDCGWGLFVREDHDVKRRVLTATSPLCMGWVARSPGPGNPTYHRYLRSLCDNKKNTAALLYLGGPLSICNQDIIPTLRVTFSISAKEGLANFVSVQKIGKLEPGDEVFWTYCISRRNLENGAIHFTPESEWKLPCCSESGDDSEGVPALKRLCKRSSQPRKNSVNLRSYRFCTYCGLNVADLRTNMKCHIALKHAAQLCAEMLDVDEYEYNPDEPITAKAFLKHLDIVSNVYNTLHSLGYKTLPACLLFDQVVGTPISLPPDLLSQQERRNELSVLVAEAKRAFKFNQVIYMRGILKPTKYEHFLRPSNSGYSSVYWAGDQPRCTEFSLTRYSMSQGESDQHTSSVKESIHNVGTMWMENSPN